MHKVYINLISIILVFAFTSAIPAAAETPTAGEGVTKPKSVESAVAPGHDSNAMQPQNGKPDETEAQTLVIPPRENMPEKKKLYSPYASLDLALGMFNPNAGQGLQNGSGGFTIGVGLGVLPKNLISYRLEYFSAGRDYDTTASAPHSVFVTSTGRMSLTTSALLLGLRISYPEERSYRFHATGGIGKFESSMSLDGMNVFTGQIVTYLEDHDSSTGYHAGAGFEMDIGEHGFIGLEYRRWFVHASFPSFGLHNVDIGGDYFAFRFGWYL